MQSRPPINSKISLKPLQNPIKVIQPSNCAFRDIEQEARLHLPNNRKAIFTDNNLLGQRRVGSLDSDAVSGVLVAVMLRAAFAVDRLTWESQSPAARVG